MPPLNLRASFFRYAFGVWTIGAMITLLFPRPDKPPFPLPTVITIGLYAVIAAFFGGLYVGWIALRVRMNGRPGPISSGLAFVCGLLNLPLWIGVVEAARRLPVAHLPLQILLGAGLFGFPVLLAEATYRHTRRIRQA